MYPLGSNVSSFVVLHWTPIASLWLAPAWLAPIS